MEKHELFSEVRRVMINFVQNRKPKDGKEAKYDQFMMGICSGFQSITGRYIVWEDLVKTYPELNQQKQEPEFPYGAYKWKCNGYGFLCRMRAIRKAKNKVN